MRSETILIFSRAGVLMKTRCDEKGVIGVSWMEMSVMKNLDFIFEIKLFNSAAVFGDRLPEMMVVLFYYIETILSLASAEFCPLAFYFIRTPGFWICHSCYQITCQLHTH